MNPQRNSQKEYKGPITITGKGVGYFEAPEEAKLGEDVEIQPDRTGNAFNGDEVSVRVLKDKRASRPGAAPRTQGEVTAIVSRAKTQFVGTLEREKGALFLVPDDKRMYKDILIPRLPAGVKSVEDGTKALVKVIDWGASASKTGPGKNPSGEIAEIIGKKGVHDVEMRSIVLEKGFETGFPAEVEEEAAHIDATENPIPAGELVSRRDFRKTLTMTIDPFDAKDFDDAISFKALGADAKGVEWYEIGVHIADVSHYVREKSALDKEAAKRGCSIYMVDRTVPMLPEVLSNDICSLNPDVDRLTFSAVFEMNDQAEIRDRWFGETVIHSHKRFTYETAQASIDAGRAGRFDAPEAFHARELLVLLRIAKKLAAQKFAAGAIDFDKDEVKFELDPQGRPLRVHRKERLDTHKLVEDYMLLANREVAEYIDRENERKGRKAGAFIYRIHDLPDPEKLADLAIFVKALGYDLESHDGMVTSKSLRRLLDSVSGTPHEDLIKTATIRSMAKAIYSTANIGHFGLAFKHYAHFTSPIRRYPDLLVHRVLFAYLKGTPIGAHEFAYYDRMASRSTDREILAAEAERSSIKYKQVEYMGERIGQVFDGTVTGVTEWGLYVEENETKCEGMVPVRVIGETDGDYYALDQKNYALVGEKTKKRYTLGDKVRFKVVGADMERKTLDYALVK